MRDFFEGNRKKLEGSIENDSAVILFSGSSPKKIGDENYPFTPNRNFYYMTGIDEPKLIFLMYKTNDITESLLFIERFDELKAKWVGAVIDAYKCSDISGIENIKYIDEFEETLAGIMFNKRIKNVYLDLENREFEACSEAIAFAEKIKKYYPAARICNIHSIIAEFRMIKEKCEIDEMRKAINITIKGVNAMLLNSKAGMYEYEIEAYFDFELKTRGVKDFAFKSIAAAGKNATVLHYSQNSDKTKDGDLILFDVGAQWNYYNGDITRTFPVNGRFTQRQREIYNIVLGGQKLIIDYIKPGVEFKSLNEKLREYYFDELYKIGLVKTKDEVSNYYYHGVSHMLGLETHDVGRHNEGILKQGMVLTVEPGLYLAEEGIGIRIEDDVLVTEYGCEVLSKDMISSPEDIERFMANGC